MEGTSKSVKPPKQRKMNPIKFCSILSVILGAISFLVVVEASQVSQGQATTKTFQARMTVNETYKPGYSNSDSAEFKTFATHFSQTIGKFLSKKLVGFKRCEVKKLASGSVIVVAYIVVDPVHIRSRSDVTADLIGQLLWDASYDTELEYTFLGHLSVSATDQ